MDWLSLNHVAPILRVAALLQKSRKYSIRSFSIYHLGKSETSKGTAAPLQPSHLRLHSPLLPGSSELASAATDCATLRRPKPSSGDPSLFLSMAQALACDTVCAPYRRGKNSPPPCVVLELNGAPAHTHNQGTHARERQRTQSACSGGLLRFNTRWDAPDMPARPPDMPCRVNSLT